MQGICCLLVSRNLELCEGFLILLQCLPPHRARLVTGQMLWLLSPTNHTSCDRSKIASLTQIFKCTMEPICVSLIWDDISVSPCECEQSLK